VSSAVRSRLRPGLAVLFLAAGIALSGCGGDEAAQPAAHHHSADPPATVEGADDTYAGLDLAEPYRRPSFTLTDTSGAAFDFKGQTAGRPTLLFFGYTQCPDVCPTTMADIAVALRGLDPAVVGQLRVVFVTTDPATDTPAVLGEYLGRFDADLPLRFIGLTGDQKAIDQAQLATGVPQAEENGRLHSSLLLLYGTDDQAHVAFDAGNTAKDIAADVRTVTGAQ
jgi:protein SCO1/2